jgi:serine/threonine protein kinase
MITVIDISTVNEPKRRVVKKFANKMATLNHENLLNILRPVRSINTHVPDGLLLIESEAPDHRLSWKTFSKLNFDLEQLLSIFRMLTVGVEYIHTNNLIFRDFHPTRIHCDEGIAKWNLIGMPYNLKKLTKDMSYTGHLNYTAPELIKDKHGKALTQKADIWALGCCFYFLLTKSDPFVLADIRNESAAIK